MRVVVAGHLCVDLTPGFAREPGLTPGALIAAGPLGAALGGSVANTARALRALGVDTTPSAALGDDVLADVVRRLLADEGLDASGIPSVSDASTSYSVVIEAPGRDRTFWHHAGANDLYTGADLDLTGVDVLHVGYPPLLAGLSASAGDRLVALFARARAAGVTTSLDLAVVDPHGPARDVDWALLLDRVLPLTDIITPSIDDLRSLAPFVDERWSGADAGALARWLVDAGAGVAVVSAGSVGFALASGDAQRLAAGGRALAALDGWESRDLTAPVHELRRFVSANGAGDSATAGFIAAVLAGATPERALDAAGAAAAASIEGRLRDGALAAEFAERVRRAPEPEPDTAPEPEPDAAPDAAPEPASAYAPVSPPSTRAETEPSWT